MSGKEERGIKPSARDLQMALKILGSAIRHLSKGLSLAADADSKGRMDAVLLLVKLDREIYEESRKNAQ